MSDMTPEQALQKIKDIAAAKGNKTSKPDATLSKELAKAMEVVKAAEAKEAAEKQAKEDKEKFDKAVSEEVLKRQQSDPLFKGGPVTDPTYNGGMSGDYRRTIQKRAGADDHQLRRFQNWNDDVLLAGLALGKKPIEVIKGLPELREFYEIEMKNSSSELAKALAAANAGAGAEWIPEIFSPELIDLVRTERNLAPAFRRFPMSSGTVRLNQLSQEFQGFVVAESTTNTPFNVPPIVSDPGTANVILIAIEMAVASIFSKTFEEDSIVPALPEIRRRIVEGMAKALEDAIINGSVESPHPDSDVASGDAATAWNGLRAAARGQDFSDDTIAVDLSGVSMTVDNLLLLIRQQGRFGARPSDNFWLTSPQGATKLMSLRDANGNQILMPIDKFGDRALLLRGSIGMMMGSSVMVSDLVKTQLDSSGVLPPTPEDRTELLRVNKEAFLIGDRRSLTIESDTEPLTRQRIMVATVREIFQRVKLSQSSQDRPVTIGDNIDTV